MRLEVGCGAAAKLGKWEGEVLQPLAWVGPSGGGTVGSSCVTGPVEEDHLGFGLGGRDFHGGAGAWVAPALAVRPAAGNWPQFGYSGAHTCPGRTYWEAASPTPAPGKDQDPSGKEQPHGNLPLRLDTSHLVSPPSSAWISEDAIALPTCLPAASSAGGTAFSCVPRSAALRTMTTLGSSSNNRACLSRRSNPRGFL